MKNVLAMGVTLVFVVALAFSAQAGDADGKVELTGWITDEWCGAKNANADGAKCAKACAKKGAKLVLFSEGKIYKLSDQETALDHVGHKVLVTGTLKNEDSLVVTRIEPVKKKA